MAYEPELERKIALDLERMDLQNKLLAKQTERLEKSQEYRCCPAPPPANSYAVAAQCCSWHDVLLVICSAGASGSTMAAPTCRCGGKRRRR